MPPDKEAGKVVERNATGLPLPGGSFIMSLGPVPNNQCKTDHTRVRSPARDPVAESHATNYRMLCPSRPRTILPHGCDQRYGRDEYASDVTDTEDECEVIIKRRGCLLDKNKKEETW